MPRTRKPGPNPPRLVKQRHWLRALGAFAALCCTAPITPSGTVPVPYEFAVVASFPHDNEAFTQGLAWAGGWLYEGTGIRGRSRLRRIELESGRVAAEAKLEDRFFGEGITVHGDQLIQLSWKLRTGFVYDLETLAEIKRFAYDHQGWGVASSGEALIVSDGSAVLRFLDPQDFTEQRRITVRERGRLVDRLNELEFVEGEVLANVWRSDRIVRIDPNSGSVVGVVDLGALRAEHGERDELNGIAYDRDRGRLFVTGKRWSKLYQLELREKP